MPFAVFFPFGMAIVYWVLTYHIKKLGKTFTKRNIEYIILAVSVMLAYVLTPNRYMIGENKENLPQYQFKQIIEHEENPTLLNYGFLDGGFYTVCNIVPNCKAFCDLNNSALETEKIQTHYVEEGLCQFIVTRDETLDFDHYTCAAESSYYFEEEIRTYYLYKLE